MEVEAIGSEHNAQGETCEWVEEKIFPWSLCKAGAGEIYFS